MVDEQRLAAHRAELVLDELIEFGQPHTIKLREQKKRATRQKSIIDDVNTDHREVE